MSKHKEKHTSPGEDRCANALEDVTEIIPKVAKIGK